SGDDPCNRGRIAPPRKNRVRGTVLLKTGAARWRVLDSPRQGRRLMFISVHIPKTGGTTFRNFLEQRYPGKVAYDYGSDSELTHRLLREKRKEASPEVLRQLKQEGIRVVHGHFPATRYAEAIP